MPRERTIEEIIMFLTNPLSWIFRRIGQQKHRADGPKRVRLELEGLETRVAPATLVNANTVLCCGRET
jgi:hypothetical protein